LLAALLHDCDDPKLFSCDTKHAHSKSILDAIGSHPKQQTLVLSIIDLVSCSKNGNKPHSPSWMLIVRDADRIEALGLVGIQRTIDYAESIGNPMFLPDTMRCKNQEEIKQVATSERFKLYASGGKSRSCIDHFYDKLLHLDELHSNNAYLCKLASERMVIMRHFVILYGSGILEKFAHLIHSPPPTLKSSSASP